eukprot:TRINITY_DN3476_c0_g1_i1.p1 TRINITY_DN3476_c0_g1~~TRINITY_DN3476_c0_g1_i1.p1  ORF type:complete len:511 (+),score=63.35 TRINITY_DN3476_c0_g1_i1:134-1666(+)
MKMDSECFYCGSPATKTCSSCNLVSFCSVGLHEKLHYGQKPSGEAFCFPFRVARDPALGRHLVATRDIKALEVILEESPLVIGPYVSESGEQCIECFKVLQKEEKHVCPTCDYPFCSSDCISGPWHQFECSVFKEHGFKRGSEAAAGRDFAFISTLRLFALRDKSPEIWKALMADMLDHNADVEEHTPDKWNYYMEKVVKKIISLTKGSADKETLIRLIGIMDTNGADLNLPQDGTHGKGTGLYLLYSNLNNSCICNTKTINFRDRRLEMRASVNIPKGTQICNQYVRPNKCTLARRTTIKNKWYFDCLCKRCEDPTECGSYLGALLCSQCKSTILPIDPLVTESDWKCHGCGEEMDVEGVMEILLSAGNSLEADTFPQDPDTYDKFLYETEGILHPNHYLRIEAEMKLLTYVGNVAKYSLAGKIPRPVLERKRQACFHVLEVLSLVDPGFNQWRVRVLSELFKTKLYLVNMDFDAGKADQNDVAKVIQEQRVFQIYLAYNQSIFLRKNK